MRPLFSIFIATTFCWISCDTISDSNPANSTLKFSVDSATQDNRLSDTGKTVALTSTPSDLLETYWKLVELNGLPIPHPVDNQQTAFIQLLKEGNRLQGSGGCNTLMGTYELADGGRLKFSDVASTRMACKDMAVENGLHNVLQMTDNYVINGNTLVLQKAKMAPLARFEAQ